MGWKEEGNINNPLENHSRIKTRWEPKISLAKGGLAQRPWDGAQSVSSHSCCQSLPAQEVKLMGRRDLKSLDDVAVCSESSTSLKLTQWALGFLPCMDKLYFAF